MFNTSDCIVLPGGFSFGDYLRCGAIARFSPMMQSVIEFANKGGKVFGVCNGFQILCESGLLPGVLLQNAHMKFACKNIFLKDDDNSARFIKFLLRMAKAGILQKKKSWKKLKKITRYFIAIAMKRRLFILIILQMDL